MKKHKKELTVLAKLLLEKEVIFSDDLEKIFGKRPFIKDPLAKKIVKVEKVEKSETKEEPSIDEKDVNNEGEISTEFA